MYTCRMEILEMSIIRIELESPKYKLGTNRKEFNSEIRNPNCKNILVPQFGLNREIDGKLDSIIEKK